MLTRSKSMRSDSITDPLSRDADAGDVEFVGVSEGVERDSVLVGMARDAFLIANTVRLLLTYA